jgi:ubiquinone biosynthesis protein
VPTPAPDSREQGREGLGLAPSPARLREILERRGPIGVKAGQFLALRPDLLPEEYSAELLHLVDEVPPFPWGQARKIIAEDLAGADDAVLAWINPIPLAAGSIAQLHEARAHSGAALAIKVLRPDARAQVARELPGVRRVARVLQLAGVLRGMSADDLVGEFSRWLNEELDARRELRNVQRLFALNTPGDAVVVPEPWPELSGDVVVTTDLLSGVPFTDLLRAVRADGEERIAEMGLDGAELASRLLWGLLRQIFVDRVFHADPHPGNLIALSGNRVGLVDFGLVDELDATTHRALAEYVSSVYVLDPDRMARGAVDLLVPGRNANPEAFHEDFVAAARTWIESRGTAGAPGGKTPVGRLLVTALAVARDNGYAVPPRLLSIYRTLLTGESVAAQLSPTTSLDSVGRSFFVEMRIRSALDSLDPERTMSRAVEGLALARDAPGALNRILGDLAEDRFVLPVRTSATPEDRRQEDRRTRLVAACLLIVALSVLLAGDPSGPLGTSDGTTAISVALLGLAGLVAILWRRLR